LFKLNDETLVYTKRHEEISKGLKIMNDNFLIELQVLIRKVENIGNEVGCLISSCEILNNGNEQIINGVKSNQKTIADHMEQI
jgi:hypothetical protein